MAFTARAALAQLVEHRIRNAGVTGSSPVSGTIFVCVLPPANPTRGCDFAPLSRTISLAARWICKHDAYLASKEHRLPCSPNIF